MQQSCSKLLPAAWLILLLPPRLSPWHCSSTDSRACCGCCPAEQSTPGRGGDTNPLCSPQQAFVPMLSPAFVDVTTKEGGEGSNSANGYEKNPPQKQEMEWDEVRNPPSKNLRRRWKLLLGRGAAEGMELEEHQGSTVPPLLGTVSVPAPGPMSPAKTRWHLPAHPLDWFPSHKLRLPLPPV